MDGNIGKNNNFAKTFINFKLAFIQISVFIYFKGRSLQNLQKVRNEMLFHWLTKPNRKRKYNDLRKEYSRSPNKSSVRKSSAELFWQTSSCKLKEGFKRVLVNLMIQTGYKLTSYSIGNLQKILISGKTNLSITIVKPHVESTNMCLLCVKISQELRQGQQSCCDSYWIFNMLMLFDSHCIEVFGILRF